MPRGYPKAKENKEEDQDDGLDTPSKRGRGRPRKYPEGSTPQQVKEIKRKEEKEKKESSTEDDKREKRKTKKRAAEESSAEESPASEKKKAKKSKTEKTDKSESSEETKKSEENIERRVMMIGALGNLARNSDELIPELIDTGALESLMKILEDENELLTVRRVALFSFGTYLQYPQCKDIITPTHFETLYQQLSTIEDSTIQRYLQRIKKNFAA